jgi:hypothetical protein
MDIEENITGYTDPEVKEYWESKSGQPYGEPEANPEQTPVMIYSLGFDAEELLAVYGGLRSYLRALVSQQDETENLRQIQRVAKLLIDLNPRAVRASKEVSLKAAGMEERNA